MEEFFDLDQVRALVYLNTIGDNKNKLLISDDQLCVIHKGKKNVLELHSIRKLKTTNKKMLLPLILGGIITPFAFLSYFVNLFHPWIHLISILLGMFLFYAGWHGRSALLIVFRNGEELIHYLPTISRNLIAFVNYANDFIKSPGAGSTISSIFVEIDREQENILFGEMQEDVSAVFPLMGFTQGQFKRWQKIKGEKQYYSFDPLKSGREIRFDYDLTTGEIRPVIDGPIKRSSIIDHNPN